MPDFRSPLEIAAELGHVITIEERYQAKLLMWEATCSCGGHISDGPRYGKHNAEGMGALHIREVIQQSERTEDG